MTVRLFWMVTLCLCALQLTGQELGMEEIRIGILGPQKPTSLQVIPEFGTYNVWADGKKIATLNARERITLVQRGARIEASLPGKVLGTFARMELLSVNEFGVFRLYVLKPGRDERVYDDHLHLWVANGQLQLVNQVDLEKYIAGVVEAESGKEKGLEFYRVQAIISRTYALSNRNRFLRKGYHLNDQVDCQVYQGKARWEPDIPEAVRATEGMVLVDSEMRLITAAFHSNSGGHTVSSEAVWSGPLPYLTPRRDDFSIDGAHYDWSRTVARRTWLAYLEDRFGIDTTDEKVVGAFTSYLQPQRALYLGDPAYKVALKDVRKDWTLNSTFFDVIDEGDSLRFQGRGFGHGTGLSQEGAMRMAQLGFTYHDILHFYYNDVHVIDLRVIEFFRE